MSVSNLQKEHPLNEIVVNRVEHLPYPTDTGDGLGLAHRLEDNTQYFFGKDIYLSYPIVPKNNTITGSREVKIIYIGSGAMIRNNSTTPIGIANFVYVTLVGIGTNQLFDVTESEADAGISFEYCFLVNFDLGNIQNLDYSFMRNVTLQEQKGKLFVDSDLVFFHATFFNPKAYIGEELLEVGQNVLSIDINNSKFIPIAGDSAFNINSSLAGRMGIVNSQVVDIYGGIPFKSGSLDQTDPRVLSKTVAGVPDSQTIGSFFMERNTTVTNPTIVGETGTITAFADAGGGQVTVTSAGHGLSNGAVVWIANSDNYNNKYTISNVATNTFEITETYVAETPISITVWETGWTKVSGATYKGENERADMTTDNELTFYNLEEQKVDINVSTNPSNDSIAAAKDWEFCVMKNDVQRLKGSIKFQEMTDKAREGFILSTSTAINGSKFSVYTRNLSDTTTDSIMVNMSAVIKA